MQNNKKFISIIWGYFKHMQDMAPEESYHLHILKIAKECGYKPYIILKGGKEFLLDDPHLDKDIVIHDYKNIFNFIYLIIKYSLQRSVFYVNSYEWQSFIVPFIARKTIFMAHTQPKRQTVLKQKIQNFVYRFFTKIRLNNEAEREFLIREGTSEKKLEVVPLVISQDTFKKTNYSDNRSGLIYFGNITAKKNLITILKAFELTKIKKSDLRLNIVGNMWDENIKEYVKQSKYKEDIVLHGFLSNEDVVKLMNQNLLYLNSSFDEGMCVAVYDAALCGLGLCLPTIMSFTHVFKYTALFHDVYDHEKLSKNIIKYLEDRDLLNSHVDKNIEMIKKNYSIESVENKLKNLINNI